MHRVFVLLMYTCGASSSQTFNMSTRGNKAWVNLNLFPHHMILDVWVEAHNKLGTVESEHLIKDATWFGELLPPIYYYYHL